VALEKRVSLDAVGSLSYARSGSKPQRGSARSVAWPVRSTTRPSKSMISPTKSTMMHSRRSAPSRSSLETCRSRNWRPRASLPS
jgi:hypothetical protein